MDKETFLKEAKKRAVLALLIKKFVIWTFILLMITRILGMFINTENILIMIFYLIMNYATIALLTLSLIVIFVNGIIHIKDSFGGEKLVLIENEDGKIYCEDNPINEERGKI